MNRALSLFALVSIILATDVILAQGPCPESLCAEKRKKIDTVCHTVGGLVYFEQSDGSMCYCKCSCVEGRTLVAVSADKMTEIHGVKKGDSVMTLGNDGAWKQSTVTYSDGSTYFNKPVYYAIYVVTTDGTDLIVTPDHLFLTAEKKLIRADQLQPNTQLMTDKLQPIGLARVVPGRFDGSFHNVATGVWDTSTVTTDHHFINTKGIVSADFYLQSVARSLPNVEMDLPKVGTKEYASQNSASLKSATALGMDSVRDVIQVYADESFTPFKPVAIPDDALNYFPKEYEVAKPNMLAPLDDSVPYEVADYLVRNYKAKFPDVEFHIDWSDDVVNAYAWMQDGTRHVALKGGLLRHQYIKVEGAGLVLAHEIGHHYGGAPRYSSGNTWASCEGQADYWGAMVAQRHVWWGPYAIEQIEKGSQQLYNLFAYGLTAGNLFDKPVPAAAGSCSHPSAACRLETYKAAITLDDKPACAGDPPPGQ